MGHRALIKDTNSIVLGYRNGRLFPVRGGMKLDHLLSKHDALQVQLERSNRTIIVCRNEYGDIVEKQ